MQAPGQVQRGSGEGSEGSREGLGFGAETGHQVQQGSGNRVQSHRFNWFNKVPEKVPEKVWKAPGQVPGFRRRFPEALVQSQVRFNRVPEKVPEKLLGSLGAKPSQVQRVPEKVADKVPEKVLGESLVQGQVRFQQVQRVSSAWFRSTFLKDCKNKTLRLLGIPPKLIFFIVACLHFLAAFVQYNYTL